MSDFIRSKFSFKNPELFWVIVKDRYKIFLMGGRRYDQTHKSGINFLQIRLRLSIQKEKK